MNKTEKIGPALIARPKFSGEEDLLLSFENELLSIRDLDDNTLRTITPSSPWSHDSLEAVEITSTHYHNGFNVYLGKQWIGSSEI